MDNYCSISIEGQPTICDSCKRAIEQGQAVFFVNSGIVTDHIDNPDNQDGTRELLIDNDADTSRIAVYHVNCVSIIPGIRQ